MWFEGIRRLGITPFGFFPEGFNSGIIIKYYNRKWTRFPSTFGSEEIKAGIIGFDRKGSGVYYLEMSYFT